MPRLSHPPTRHLFAGSPLVFMPLPVSMPPPVFMPPRSSRLPRALLQNELPLLSDWDKQCIIELGKEFEIDFINCSYVRTGADVREAHE